MKTPNKPDCNIAGVKFLPAINGCGTLTPTDNVSVCEDAVSDLFGNAGTGPYRIDATVTDTEIIGSLQCAFPDLFRSDFTLTFQSLGSRNERYYRGPATGSGAGTVVHFCIAPSDFDFNSGQLICPPP